MKHFLIPSMFFLIFLCNEKLCFAQIVDFDKVVLPVDKASRDSRELLVQLAWRNMPDNATASDAVKIANQEIKLAKLGYVDAVQFSFGFTPAIQSSGFPQNIEALKATGDPDILRQLQFFPSVAQTNNVFGINAALNLGKIASTPGKIKIAQFQKKATENTVNQRKLMVRAEVLDRYQKYVTAGELLKAKVQNEQDAYSNFILLQELFKRDKASFKDYNDSAASYHSAVDDKIRATGDLSLAKIRVEELIGIRLEDAIKGQ
jgi:outer membrane protein TolC